MHPCSPRRTALTPPSWLRAAFRVTAPLALPLLLVGCHSTPRPQIDHGADIAAAIGLPAPVEFREVDAEGGPIDEPARAGDSLTLADALRRAVTTDPALQAAMARIRIALADADQARTLPNPVLNLVLRWGSGKPQIEASLAENFVQALQSPRRASAADHRLRQASAQAITVALDVAGEVQERYLAAQASASLLPLLSERLTLLEQLASTAQARLHAGEGTRADVSTLSAQRVELLVEIDGVRLTQREERLRLARLIGEPSSQATWTLEPWTSTPITNQPESAWIDAGLRHRPEIQALAWHLKALGDEQALARLLPWEDVSAGIDAQRDGSWTVGPSLSTPLPIFDTGDARRARLTAEQMEARHQLTLEKRKVVEEIRVAFQTLAASNLNLARIHNELIPLQRQRRQLAEDAYRAGQTDVTALFLAEQDLRLAQARSIEVEHQAAMALIRLRRAVGGPGVAASIVAASPSTNP